MRSTIPNDLSFPLQWNFYNDGTTGGIADADIDADEAWDITTGGLTALGDSIVIAVIDDGFDINHLDLNFWKTIMKFHPTELMMMAMVTLMILMVGMYLLKLMC